MRHWHFMHKLIVTVHCNHVFRLLDNHAAEKNWRNQGTLETGLTDLKLSHIWVFHTHVSFAWFSTSAQHSWERPSPNESRYPIQVSLFFPEGWCSPSGITATCFEAGQVSALTQPWKWSISGTTLVMETCINVAWFDSARSKVPIKKNYKK